MDQNTSLIVKFYQAFQQRDWKGMQACYHPQAQFSDPAFPGLNCQQTKAMWHMLCENARDFSLEYSDVKALANKGSCQWQARYSFSRTGRQVHNVILAQFEFKDGLIINHTDAFDFWRWSRQALGPTGIVLGWTRFLQRKVQSTARASLAKFMAQNQQYAI
jgi:ketosteroid isomerase-like protein